MAASPSSCQSGRCHRESKVSSRLGGKSSLQSKERNCLAASSHPDGSSLRAIKPFGRPSASVAKDGLAAFLNGRGYPAQGWSSWHWTGLAAAEPALGRKRLQSPASSCRAPNAVGHEQHDRDGERAEDDQIETAMLGEIGDEPPHQDVLQALPLPFDTRPFALHATWHARFDNDRGHQWLRQQLKDCSHLTTRASVNPFNAEVRLV